MKVTGANGIQNHTRPPFEAAAVQRFIDQTLKIMRLRDEFTRVNQIFNNPNINPKILSLFLNGASASIKFKWAIGEVSVERRVEGNEKLLEFCDARGRVRTFVWQEENGSFAEKGAVIHGKMIGLSLLRDAILKSLVKWYRGSSSQGRLDQDQIEVSGFLTARIATKRQDNSEVSFTGATALNTMGFELNREGILALFRELDIKVREGVDPFVQTNLELIKEAVLRQKNSWAVSVDGRERILINVFLRCPFAISVDGKDYEFRGATLLRQFKLNKNLASIMQLLDCLGIDLAK